MSSWYNKNNTDWQNKADTGWNSKNNTQFYGQNLGATWDSLIYTWDSLLAPWNSHIKAEEWFTIALISWYLNLFSSG
jgi:hypothetical protein